MLRLWTRPQKRVGSAQQSARLRLDHLESRDCPSSPTMIEFNVTRLQGRNIAASGRALYTDPATMQIRLTGAASAIFSLNSNGEFSGNAVTSGFGQIQCRVFSMQGTPLSKPYYYDYQNLAPGVTFQITQSGPGQFSVSGVVSDEDPHLSNVSISGIGSGQTTPDSLGNFSYTLPPAQPGLVNVQVTDSLGLQSPVVSLPATNNAPVFHNVQVERSGNLYLLSGFVIDEAPHVMTVGLQSTVPQVNNQFLPVDSGGYFSRSFLWKAGQPGGFVTLYTVDWFGVSATPLTLWIGP